jgi:hypothetical protein
VTIAAGIFDSLFRRPLRQDHVVGKSGHGHEKTRRDEDTNSAHAFRLQNGFAARFPSGIGGDV